MRNIAQLISNSNDRRQEGFRNQED